MYKLKRGINFVSKRNMCSGDFLKIFTGINLNNYKVRIGFQELYDCKNYDPIQITENMSWESFIDFFKDNKFDIIFLELFACKRKSDEDVFPVDYKNFMKSEFEIAMFVYDGAYVDFYSKNQEIIEIVMKNIHTNMSYSNLEYTTDKNDSRTKFRVW